MDSKAAPPRQIRVSECVHLPLQRRPKPKEVSDSWTPKSAGKATHESPICGSGVAGHAIGRHHGTRAHLLDLGSVVPVQQQQRQEVEVRKDSQHPCWRKVQVVAAEVVKGGAVVVRSEPFAEVA